jgi:hypothetical protein
MSAARSVTLHMDPVTARALWHAACTTVELMDKVDDIPAHAPLYGQRDRLVAVARELDQEINHAGEGAKR